jgi:hypothetical protein
MSENEIFSDSACAYRFVQLQYEEVNTDRFKLKA